MHTCPLLCDTILGVGYHLLGIVKITVCGEVLNG